MTDPHTSPGPFWTRRPLRWALAALLLLIVAAGLMRALRSEEVQTVSPEMRSVRRTLVLVGRVRPPSRTALGTTVAGIVREVRVREGDRVGRGDRLVSLDDREARAALTQAEAALAEVTASVGATVEQSQLELTQALRDLDRIRTVFQEGARTQQQVEQAEQRAADARSRLQAAQATAEGIGNASVARARSALDAARARWQLMRVEAPADGIVLKRWVEPGDAVQPGQTLLEVATEGPTELVVFPSEENLGQLRVGAPALASPDAYPDSVFKATVSLIAPSVDADQGTVEVRLAVAEPPSYLLADMTLSVNIEAGRRDNVLVLSAESIRGLGTSQPWVASVESGRLERRDIVVGLQGDAFVEILEGVSTDDAVVAPEGSPDMGARVRARPQG